MTRTVALLIAGLVLQACAAHAANPPLHQGARLQGPLLQGPMPQLGAASASGLGPSEPAPTPNVDLQAPDPARFLDTSRPRLAARLSQPQQHVLRDGNGYSPGSRFNDDLQRRSRNSLNQLAPTIGLKVPLP